MRRHSSPGSPYGDRAALNVVNPTQANPTHTCVALWEQDAATGGDRLPDVDPAFERVVKKVKRKLTQTRSGQSRRRLVVVDTWTTEHLDQLDVDPDVYVRGRVLGDRAGYCHPFHPSVLGQGRLKVPLPLPDVCARGRCAGDCTCGGAQRPGGGDDRPRLVLCPVNTLI